MKLAEYIKQNHGGNQSKFAEANDMTKQQVSGMVKKNVYYVYDGMLVIARREVK